MKDQEPRYKTDGVGFYKETPEGDIARPIAFTDHGWALGVDTPALDAEREQNRTRLETTKYKFTPRERNGYTEIYNALKHTAEKPGRYSNTLKRRI